MLTLEKVNAGYDKLHVLYDISLSIPDKKITVIVGPNGSGKSTLLKTIFGLSRIYSGKILYDGKEITGQPPHIISRMGIAYLPQTRNVFDNLTVEENLKMASYTLDKEKTEERIEKVLDIFPILRGFMKRKARYLSGGEKQMLAMAMALLREPRVMMFDEPTAALAPKIAYQVLDIIESLKKDHGITIVLVEQNAKIALERGDKAVLLASGNVIFEGGCEELLSHPELGRLYLGLRGRNGGE